MQGQIYILTNQAMPGLVKIGRTSRDVDVRAAELWQTGVPEKFDVFWSSKTPDCVQIERHVHRDLCEHRVSTSREFFRVEPEVARDRCRFWLDIQAQFWIGDNFSEYWPVHVSTASATSAISELSEKSGFGADLVADALGAVTLEELWPALDRVLEIRRRERLGFSKQAGVYHLDQSEPEA